MSFRAYMIVTPSGGRGIETVEGVAKRAAKMSSGSYRPIEIPSNKSELVGWINELLSDWDGVPRITEPASSDITALMDDSPFEPDPLRRTLAQIDQPEGVDVDAIGETILKSSGYVLATIAEAVAMRFDMLAKSARRT